MCGLNIICTFFEGSTYGHSLQSSRSISPITNHIFSKNFLTFKSDTIKKQDFINLSNYSSQSYIFVELHN